jgi:hypothetical protein
LVTDNEPIGNEAVDEPGHPALAEHDPVGQAVHAQAPVGRFGKRQERVVLAKRQVVLDAQLLVEPSRDAGVRDQERAPRQQPLVARGFGMKHIDFLHRRDRTLLLTR